MTEIIQTDCDCILTFFRILQHHWRIDVFKGHASRSKSEIMNWHKKLPISFLVTKNEHIEIMFECNNLTDCEHIWHISVVQFNSNRNFLRHSQNCEMISHKAELIQGYNEKNEPNWFHLSNRSFFWTKLGMSWQHMWKESTKTFAYLSVKLPIMFRE